MTDGIVNVDRIWVNAPILFAQFGLDRPLPKWAPIDWSKQVLHLGPGRKHIDDTHELEWPEFDFDKSDCLARYGDGRVGGIVATHVLEHLADPRHLLREASRVLAPGCPFNILVPHGASLMFLQDLDHKTPFVIETWKTLIDNPYYAKDHDGFDFEVGANFLYGVKEDNLALVTQLIRTGAVREEF